MVKTRLGLFSGVFLMAVGSAHSWPQLAAAVCVDPPVLSLCFDEFLNSPIGGATLEIINDELVVGNLTGSRAGVSDCTAGSGDEICLGDDAEEAGDEGYTVDHDKTVIPDDTTAFYVELDGYWGISCQTADTCPWTTVPIPIGFEKVGTDVIGCANFNVNPINCTHILVKFRGGSDSGDVRCPGGDLFTIDDATVEIQKVRAIATCPGNSPCSESEARAKAELEFQLKDVESLTVNSMCKNPNGSDLASLEFTAKSIFIKPDLENGCTVSACCGREVACEDNCPEEGCPTAEDRAIDGAFSRGGNTPPIKRIRLLGAETSRSNRGLVPGSFIITKETIGFVPTVGTWGLVVMVQLVLVAGTMVFRRRLPAISTIGYGC